MAVISGHGLEIISVVLQRSGSYDSQVKNFSVSPVFGAGLLIGSHDVLKSAS